MKIPILSRYILIEKKEFALMALALERVEDENGYKTYNQAMIYDWLDRIRQMGLEQRVALTCPRIHVFSAIMKFQYLPNNLDKIKLFL